MGEEEEKKTPNPKSVDESHKLQDSDQNVLKFMDSLDAYLTLMDSLSSTLRQGWLEFASARHSMGAYRINSALLDCKEHSASTYLSIEEAELRQPHFSLCMWGSFDSQHPCTEDEKISRDELQQINDQPRLRRRATAELPELQEQVSPRCNPGLKADDPVQKERSKSLSMFGTLVSPKLRAAQLSFETALEKLVQIANMRSSMVAAYDNVQDDLKELKHEKLQSEG